MYNSDGLSKENISDWLHSSVTIAILNQIRGHVQEQTELAITLLATCNKDNMDRAMAMASSVTTLKLLEEQLRSVDGLRGFLEMPTEDTFENDGE